MQVADTFLSHPDKSYNDHIRRIAESFDDKNHKQVASFHDLGKLSDQFQTYISLKKEPNESNNEFEKRRNKLRTTHTLESAYLYFCNEKNKDNHFLANFFSILKHHSNLGDINNEIKTYISVIEISKDRLSIIKDISNQSNISFSEDTFLFKYFFKKNIDDSLYDIENFFLFKKRYSRLILADKFEAIFSQPYKNLDYFEDNDLTNHIRQIENIISQKQEKSINEYRTKARKTIFENFEKDTSSNIYLIKAPTGVGKTFIALELALKIAKVRNNKRRIITSIPFTSIIDQTHSEYEGILGVGKVLKYHHLTKYEKDINDDKDEKEQFSQKVFLADIWHEHFIVTTFNQLLYTFFSNHNRDNVRLETLRDSVIIVDEVQNIPRVLLPSIVKIFDAFASRYAIDFIIMSATMPSFKGLLSNAKVLSEDWFYEEKKNRYRLFYKKELNGFDALSAEINEIKDRSILCVVNTIEKAKKLFDKIEGAEGKSKFLLTTHQIPLHRQDIISEIKKALANNEKITLISTQLIEAGVDLDFDVGFREFAPFGAIVQMAGRVNREGSKGICDVFIFDFLEVESKNEEIKKLPYHRIDLQENNIKDWLKNPLEEIEILENLDTYFETLTEQTSCVDLETPMKNLEFATLKKRLDENFMPHQPWKVSLFIEQKENQFDDFIVNREAIFNKNENKFEAITKVKELEKDLELYMISVNHKLVDKLRQQHPIRELFGRYVLPNGSPAYEKYRGFSPEITSIEEAFS